MINWQRYAVHSFPLSINAALDIQRMIQNLIGYVHKIAGFSHSLTIGQTKLAKYQTDQGIKETEPPLVVITKFNNTFNCWIGLTRTVFLSHLHLWNVVQKRNVQEIHQSLILKHCKMH